MRTKKKHLRKMIEKLKHNKLVDNFTSSNAFNTNWAAVQHFKLRPKKISSMYLQGSFFILYRKFVVTCYLIKLTQSLLERWNSRITWAFYDLRSWHLNMVHWGIFISVSSKLAKILDLRKKKKKRYWLNRDWHEKYQHHLGTS